MSGFGLLAWCSRVQCALAFSGRCRGVCWHCWASVNSNSFVMSSNYSRFLYINVVDFYFFFLYYRSVVEVFFSVCLFCAYSVMRVTFSCVCVLCFLYGSLWSELNSLTDWCCKRSVKYGGRVATPANVECLESWGVEFELYAPLKRKPVKLFEEFYFF